MKLKNIKSNTIVKQIIGDQDEAPMHDIYLNKTLTQENRKLLKELKGKAKKLKDRHQVIL